MTPEEQQYLKENTPERFFRVQLEIPPASALDISKISVQVCHQGKYTGSINSDGSPGLDVTDIPLGTIIEMENLSAVSSKALNPEKFNEACLILFQELNRQATVLIKQARGENTI